MILDIMVLAFGVAVLRGGSFKSLASVNLKNLWLVFVVPVVIAVLAVARAKGFELQVLRVSGILHIAAAVPWLIFLWTNRRIAGTLLISAGVLMNLLPIASNSGRMPISLKMAYVANVGKRLENYSQKKAMERHCYMSEETHFNWLADWVPIPKPPFYLDPTVASPGDIFSTIGMFILIQSVMGAPLRKSKNEKNA